MSLTARDVMQREVFTIRDDSTVDDLASLLIARGISGVPVVDRTGKLVGVATATDIVEERSEMGEATHPEGRARGWEDRMSANELDGLRVKPQGALVRDIMTPTVYTIAEELAVDEIARTMVAGRVHRLFVTRRGELVGIVSALDLLKIVCEGSSHAHERLMMCEG